MSKPYQPVHLPASHVRQASLVLARAFYRDPLYVYLMSDDVQRERLLPSFQSLTVRYALRYGEVYAIPGLEGVACWLAPGNTTPTLWRMLRVALRGAPASFGISGYRRYAPIGVYTEKMHEQVAPDPHWYLWVLGVDPSRQRQGLGSQLIQPILARANRDHLPCYLETMNEANLPFYVRRGFTVVSDGVVPGTGLRVWGMRRG